jgi:hypothetical protein
MSEALRLEEEHGETDLPPCAEGVEFEVDRS